MQVVFLISPKAIIDEKLKNQSFIYVQQIQIPWSHGNLIGLLDPQSISVGN